MSQYSACHLNNPVLLIGVQRQLHQVLLNPRPCELSALDPSDILIVMAYQPIRYLA